MIIRFEIQTTPGEVAPTEAILIEQLLGRKDTPLTAQQLVESKDAWDDLHPPQPNVFRGVNFNMPLSAAGVAAAYGRQGGESAAVVDELHSCQCFICKKRRDGEMQRSNPDAVKVAAKGHCVSCPNRDPMINDDMTDNNRET